MSDMVFIQISRNEWDSLVEMVKRLQLDAPSPKRSGEIIDRKELCKRLDVTQQTIINWEKRGRIPVLRQGNVIRYDWEEIEKTLTDK